MYLCYPTMFCLDHPQNLLQILVKPGNPSNGEPLCLLLRTIEKISPKVGTGILVGWG